MVVSFNRPCLPPKNVAVAIFHHMPAHLLFLATAPDPYTSGSHPMGPEPFTGSPKITGNTDTYIMIYNSSQITDIK